MPEKLKGRYWFSIKPFSTPFHSFRRIFRHPPLRLRRIPFNSTPPPSDSETAESQDNTGRVAKRPSTVAGVRRRRGTPFKMVVKQGEKRKKKDCQCRRETRRGKPRVCHWFWKGAQKISTCLPLKPPEWLTNGIPLSRQDCPGIAAEDLWPVACTRCAPECGANGFACDKKRSVFRCGEDAVRAATSLLLQERHIHVLNGRSSHPPPPPPAIFPGQAPARLFVRRRRRRGGVRWWQCWWNRGRLQAEEQQRECWTTDPVLKNCVPFLCGSLPNWIHSSFFFMTKLKQPHRRLKVGGVSFFKTDQLDAWQNTWLRFNMFS